MFSPARVIDPLSTGHTLDWFYVVLAGLTVFASLIFVAMTVQRDKLFWTFSAFTVTLLVLLAVGTPQRSVL